MIGLLCFRKARLPLSCGDCDRPVLAGDNAVVIGSGCRLPPAQRNRAILVGILWRPCCDWRSPQSLLSCSKSSGCCAGGILCCGVLENVARIARARAPRIRAALLEARCTCAPQNFRAGGPGVCWPTSMSLDNVLGCGRRRSRSPYALIFGLGLSIS